MDYYLTPIFEKQGEVLFFVLSPSSPSPPMFSFTVNQQILAAIKFGVSQNKVIYVNLAAIKFGVSPRPVYAVYDRRICWRRQILAKTRNSPNSPNIIARQNLLIYSISQFAIKASFLKFDMCNICNYNIAKMALALFLNSIFFI